MDKSGSRKNLQFEALMRESGEFGLFQKRLCALLLLSAVPNGYFALSMVFIGRTPAFRCIHAQLEGQKPLEMNASYPDPLVFKHSNTAETPNEGETLVQEKNYGVRSASVVYLSLRKHFDNKCSTFANASEASNISRCSRGYVFDFEVGRTSIVTEWNLVCDRAWIKPLITSIYMGGVLVGSFISGVLADKFGRYPTFIGGTLFMFVFLGLCGVSSSPVMFSVFLFFAGLFGFTNYLAAFIISAEIICTKNRVVTGTLSVGGFAVGYMFLPLFAYFIGDWRTLCFVLASTGIIFVPYIWLIPESPRWLLSKGRRSDFSKLYLKIAGTNGLSTDRAKELLEKLFDDMDSPLELSLLNDVGADAKVDVDSGMNPKKEYSYLDLLCISSVLPRTLCMWFIWFVCAVVYYCVAFNTSNMGGNPYTNCFIAAAVEIPAYAIVIIVLRWQGRKPILSSSLLVAGLTCAVVPYLETINSSYAVVSAMIGKFAISGAFNVVFIFCCELFPTLMRSMGVGSSSMAARIGGIAAPYLLYLGNSNKFAPFLIMGLLGIAAAAVNLLLPETRASVMPETIEDLKPTSCFGFLSFKSRRSRTLVNS